MSDFLVGLILGMLLTVTIFNTEILLGLDADSEIKRCQKSIPRDINCKIIAVDDRILEIKDKKYVIKEVLE